MTKYLDLICSTQWLQPCHINLVQSNLWTKDTLEHYEFSCCILCRDVVFSEVQNVLNLYGNQLFGTLKSTLCREVYYIMSLSRRVQYRRLDCSMQVRTWTLSSVGQDKNHTVHGVTVILMGCTCSVLHMAFDSNQVTRGWISTTWLQRGLGTRLTWAECRSWSGLHVPPVPQCKLSKAPTYPLQHSETFHKLV